MTGACPPPPVMGAVQTLSSVLSPAFQCATSVNGSPAESVTPLVVAPVLLHAPTSTTSRSPGPRFAGRVTDCVPAVPWAPVCCTNVGVLTVPGVTALEAAEAGDVPIAFVAVTLKVYAVPLVSPVTVAVVAGGLPVTVIGVCAVVPTYGVTVYPVTGLPLFGGAVHRTVENPSPAVALTPVGAAGAVGAWDICTIEATDGTPLSLTMNSM